MNLFFLTPFGRGLIEDQIATQLRVDCEIDGLSYEEIAEVIEDIEEKKRKIVVPKESEHSVFKAYLRGLRQGEQNALQDLAEHYKSIKDRV